MVTIKDLTEEIIKFRDERDWKKYHTVKNLALSISIELGELFELFQWKTEEEIEKDLESDSFRTNVSDELADVAIYLFALTDVLSINLENAILEKLRKNEKKYPKHT